MSIHDLENHLRDYFPFGLPVSRRTWERLDLARIVTDPASRVPGSDTYVVRQLAAFFNETAHTQQPPLTPISPGQLITAAMIVEIMRYVVLHYCRRQNPFSLQAGLNWTAERKSRNLAEVPPAACVVLFPPPAVLVDGHPPGEYLHGQSALGANKELVVAEMILLMIAMINPAFRFFRPLYDDTELSHRAHYRDLVDALGQFFETQPPVDEVGDSLFHTLLAPIENHPDSLEAQLDFIRTRWARLLPAGLLKRLLLVRDILREEHFLRGFSDGSLEVLRLGRGQGVDFGYPEPEAFSQDADWMSNVVLIAKSTYVWLDQLSKKYGRHIRLLSDIPDEELDRLARWGFTGLWLIGVWERSRASQTIKQYMGNPEAVSSAYSLYDYIIAHDLGGESAYEELRARAWRRGIRLSADMVPNHMGIYSRWVIEHPDWFIQSPYPPFPVYQYTGANLSDDPRVVLQIEDGYWSHRDAAVVFKRIDTWTGDTRYIYHGNDGTNMPWNDTAQLNFLIPEVREAVIQTILHVARKFPIIRFDAAMTLAKKHYQRLWFPQPGDGGAIPSRAECGLTKEQFDAAFPKEFWREVVDRIKAEVPETLLLAEAFWLMEGYFVRTLGMHRVYNSAFMNMLKMEENSKYRQTVKNVLEFSPEVLKRFVNFMNNPDERTAVEQFGKGDKYIGVALMMVTMPGLPMFGHGQIEGFAEKYGMEYRRAYWDEQVDEDLVRRHEHEIFPIMRRRRLFSGADNFAFFDFHSTAGWVDENVFAYSNRFGDERALILYNNAYSTTEGWINTSTAINVGPADSPFLVHRTLSEALALRTGETDLYVFRDYKSGRWFIRAGREIAERGLFAVIGGYQYHAFLDWREIHDHDGSWRNLMHRLNGGGVHDIDEAHRELVYEPILAPFREAFSVELLRLLATPDPDPSQLADYEAARIRFLGAVGRFIGGAMNEVVALTEKALSSQPHPTAAATVQWPRLETAVTRRLAQIDDLRARDTVVICELLRPILDWQAGPHVQDPHELMRERLEKWLLRKSIAAVFAQFYQSDYEGYVTSLLVATLLTADNPLLTEEIHLAAFFADSHGAELLQVNRHNDIVWFGKERWERLVRAWAANAVVELGQSGLADDNQLDDIFKKSANLIAAGELSGYQVARLLALTSPDEPRHPESSLHRDSSSPQSQS